MSKREDIRKQRQAQARKTRLLIIGGITVFVVLIIGAITIPALVENNKPVGEITIPPLNPRPQPDGMAMGAKDAPVELVEYSDFQCPHCKTFADTFEPGFVERYVATGKVRFIYRPLTVIGPESDSDALAAYCAADQNKFWEYKDILFANVNSTDTTVFSTNRLLAYAEKLGLDMTTFEDCVKTSRHKDQLTADRAAGIDAARQAEQLLGTPSIYINGEFTEIQQIDEKISSLLGQ